MAENTHSIYIDGPRSYPNIPRQQPYIQLDRQCLQCSSLVQRFAQHSNTAHFSQYALDDPTHVIDEIIKSFQPKDCLDCKCHMLMLKIHLNIQHLPTVPTGEAEMISRQQVLDIVEHLLDDSLWLEACMTCHNHMDAFANHIQIEHHKEQIVETATDVKEDIFVDNNDHNYFETDTLIVNEEIEVDAGSDTTECVNEYLSNTSEKVYFKIHSTGSGGSLYTCTYSSCLAVCRNQVEMLEHSQEHLNADVVEELDIEFNTELVTHYQNGRGLAVPMDYQCGVCKEVYSIRHRVQKCLDIHDRYKPTERMTPSKPIICHVCETEHMDAKALQQHLQDCHGKSVRIVTDDKIHVKLVIKCPRCPLVAFDDISKAMCHRKEFHGLDDRPFLVGSRCVLRSDGSETFIRHPISEFALGSKFLYEFHCICGRDFKSNEEKAQRCLAKHTNIKSYMCSEVGCARQYYTATELALHERRIHRKLIRQANTVVCHLCGRTIGKLGMKSHMQWHQMGGEEAAKQRLQRRASLQPKSCPVCKKVYSNVAQMRRHVRRVHQKMLDFACKVCDRRFTYYQAAELCEAKHQGGRSVPCAHCGKMFYTKSQKTNHQLQVHVKRQKSADK